MDENNRLSSSNIFNTNIDSTDRFDLVTQL
jgi:hypothetical protein